MRTITVALGERAYPITIGPGMLDRLIEFIEIIHLPLVSAAIAVVTDTNVAPLYADHVTQMLTHAGARPALSVLPAGEAHKRLDAIEHLCGDFLEAGLDRASWVIALGGGVIGDITGFAAASYMRGIPFVQIPTTIVAQVDSSVGGKTGVNHPLGKNIIGAFHQPSGVLMDLAVLRTLPMRELRAGLAEVIKHGVIADAQLFEYLEQNATTILEGDLAALEEPIRRSCEIKAAIVAEDEHENARRAILNYGHTFGHAIEAVSGYTRFLHGEAVALGMHAAAHLAQALGMVTEAFVERQKACIERYGLPVAWRALPVDEAMAAMRHDKKARAGALTFILPTELGNVIRQTGVSEEAVRAALTALRGE